MGTVRALSGMEYLLSHLAFALHGLAHLLHTGLAYCSCMMCRSLPGLAVQNSKALGPGRTALVAGAIFEGGETGRKEVGSYAYDRGLLVIVS